MAWKRSIISIILFLSFGLIQISAQNPIILDGITQRHEIHANLSILPDESGQWSIQEITQPEFIDQFVPNTQQTLNFGFTNTNYWLRFTIRNATDITQKQFLFQQFPYIRYIDLYTEQLDGSYERQQNGTYVAPENRSLLTSDFVYPLQIAPQSTQTYYVHIRPLGGLVRLGLTLRSPENLFDYFESIYALWVFLAGGVFMLAIYNLLHFFLIRDVSYLYYSLFATTLIFLITFERGWGHVFIRPYIAWWSEDFNVPNKFLLLCFYVQYGRSLLNLTPHFPRIDRCLQVGAWLAGLTGIYSFIFHSFALSNWANYGLPAAFLIITLMSAVRAWQRYIPAYWLLGGSFGFSLGIGLAMLRAINIIPDDLDYYLASALISLGLEALFMSMGLGSRYQIMREEKEKAQTEALNLQHQIVDELRRADQLKDEFLANVSHELRTPLHGIIGLGEAIQTDTALTGTPHRDNLKLIISSAQRLTTLVNDILDFSRIRNQDLELQLRQVELLSLLRLVEGICLPMVGNKPVTLILNVPNEPVWMVADENRLQQIFINLLSNAIKFTHTGEIQIILRCVDDSVAISIQDTGIGIAPEQQDRIFQPFSQADGSISREYGGTGLGLAITQQLVTLHGGELTVDSQLGKGTIFTVSLPKNAPSAMLEHAVPQLPMTKRSSPVIVKKPQEIPVLKQPDISANSIQSSEPLVSILVVDDESVNVKILESQLTEEGYSIQTAVDGIQALEAVDLQQPDLILLDVMMPRLNGYEVCRQLRTSYPPTQLPIIMLTARTQITDLVQGLQAGANDYLTKPFQKEELLARVRSQLQQKQASEILQENQRLQWEIERAQRQELALRLSQKRLSLILDTSQEAVIAVNEDDIIIYSNRLASEWLHYEPNQLLDRPINRLIPDRVPDHPLTQSKETLFQQSTSIQHAHVTLVGKNETLWEGKLWQTLLDYEETVRVLTLCPLAADTASTLAADTASTVATATPLLIEELNHNRHRLQQLIDVLADLNPYPLKDHPTLMNDLRQIDQALANLTSAKPVLNPEQRFRELVVTLMRLSVECWEHATQTTLIELAENSGIWTTYTDQNSVRARAAERYLDIKRLPQKPRWRNVTRTANYVLGHCSLPDEQHQQLADVRNQLLQVVHQRHLS